MSAKGCPRRTTPPDVGAAWAQMHAVADALNALKHHAHQLRRYKAAPNLRKRIQHALSSAYGAHRHSVAVYLDVRDRS